MKNATNIAMKNAPRFVDDTHVLVTKAFMKNARIFGTPEYKMWKEIRMDCPKAVMVPKTIKKNPNKRVNTKNMTYPRMKLFISLQDNSEALLEEFEKQKQLSKVQTDPYRYVLAWFLQTFENYDMDYKAFFETQAKMDENKQNASCATDADAEEDFE